ncbi:hypothetical protein ACFOVT_18010, partial [Novosphingobium lubricantis]
TTSASRSLPIISSGRCFLLGIPCLLRNPKYHQFWTTQKGADQESGFDERDGLLAQGLRHDSLLLDIGL